MENVIRLAYSKRFAYFTISIFFLMSVFISAVIWVAPPSKSHHKNALFIMIGFVILFTWGTLIYCVRKYLLPALTGKIAMELNPQGIIDNVRNNQVAWDNVNNLKLVSGARSALVAVYLKDSSLVVGQAKGLMKRLLFWNNNLTFQTPVVIPLQYIDGGASEIFETMQSYFKEQAT